MIKLYATKHIGTGKSGATYRISTVDGAVVDVHPNTARSAYQTRKASPALRHAVSAALGEEVFVETRV